MDIGVNVNPYLYSCKASKPHPLRVGETISCLANFKFSSLLVHTKYVWPVNHLYMCVYVCVHYNKMYFQWWKNSSLKVQVFVVKNLLWQNKTFSDETHFVAETPSLKVLAMKNFVNKSPIWFFFFFFFYF